VKKRSEVLKKEGFNTVKTIKHTIEDEEKNKKPILLLFLYSFSLIFLIISGSFTVATIINQSTLPNYKVNVGKLSMEMLEKSDTTIRLVGARPMSDEQAKKLKPLLFKIHNNGTHPLKYRLRLVDVPYNELKGYKEIIGKTRIENSKIRYSLYNLDAGVTVSTGIVSNLEHEILIQKNLPAAKVDNYALRLWIDEKAGNEIVNKFYAGKIKLEIEDIIERDNKWWVKRKKREQLK